MNDFEKYLRKKAAEEQKELPEAVKRGIEQTLASLPEAGGKKARAHVLPRFAAAAACLVFIALFLLPNVSVVYAQALEQVPVIGAIVRVVTFRNYSYSDDRHEMDIDVPQIEEEDNKFAEYINMDIDELTDSLVMQFSEELEIDAQSGYGSLLMSYDVITDTEQWFTLRLSVMETAASSNQYYKYYHIDKRGGKIVKLCDLFNTDRFSDTLSAEIKAQMQQQMSADENIQYWISDGAIGADFSSVSDNQNFYWNDNGDLVIVFDKYEVGPGSMGTPEFAISRNTIKDILKPEFLDMMR